MNLDQVSAIVQRRIADSFRQWRDDGKLPKGEQGLQGAAGKDGRDGDDGQDGRPGKDGKDGRDGRDGKDGLHGKDGEAGKSVEEKSVRTWIEELIAEFLRKHRELFRGERGLSGVVIRDRMIVKDSTTTIEGARLINFSGSAVTDGGDGTANVDLDSTVTVHVGLADPHTQYLTEAAAGAVVGGTLGSVLFVGAGPVVAEDNTNFKWGTTAGQGLTLNAGAATTAVSALAVTQTWNNAAITYAGIKYTITDTASAAGSLPFQILGGASGTTNLLSVGKNGEVVAPIFDTYEGSNIVVRISGGNADSLRFGSGEVAGWSSAESATGAVSDFGVCRLSAGLGGIGNGSQASFAGSLKLTNTQNVGYVEVDEMTAPAGAANSARLFTQDNGAGKTQLMVIFGSGAAIQLAIEV